MIDRRLLVLQALAEYGTVTATAEALSYTPSAVSAQLRSLAEHLGVTLLRTEGRLVRLTPAGRLLADRAAELARLSNEIHADIAQRGNAERSLLRLCGFSTPMAALLPRLANSLQEQHPYLQVRIEEADPLGCFQKLVTETADLAVLVVNDEVPSVNDPRFEQSLLVKDPLDLLVHEDSSMAAMDSVDFATLASAAWITDRVGSANYQLFLTTCLSAGFTPSIAHHASDWDAAAALVTAGLGIALIPRLADLPGRYPVRRVQLQDSAVPTRSVIVASRAGGRRDPVIAEALDTLDELASTARRAITTPHPTD